MYTNQKKIVNILGYKEFNLHSTLFYSIHTHQKTKTKKKQKKLICHILKFSILRG